MLEKVVSCARKRTNTIASLSSFRNIFRLQYTNFMLQRILRTRLWTGVCVTLMAVARAPEAHQNDRSYVCELRGLTFNPLRKKFAWWAVTRRTSKKHKAVEIEGGGG